MTRRVGNWLRILFIGCFAAMLLPGTVWAAYEPPAVYKDNQWDMLVLIYINVDAPDFKRQFNFTGAEAFKARVEERLQSEIHEISGGRMEIRTLDIFIIDEPIRSVQPDGTLRYGFQGDIDFEPYLDGHDYNLVTVVAPLEGHPGNYGWNGMAGPTFSYRGKTVYYNLLVPGLPLFYEITTDMIHEIVHDVEANSRANGWSGFTEMHSRYNRLRDEGWFAELMQDKIEDGSPGFRPESFLVPHWVNGPPVVVDKENPEVLAAVIQNGSTEFQGHRYQLIENGMAWSEAEAYCESQGGHLATITSPAEQAFLNRLLETGTRNSYWLGGKLGSDNCFAWVMGEDFIYTNWAFNQPDHLYRETALMAYRNRNPLIYNDFGEWNNMRPSGTIDGEDFWGLSNFGLVCEWDPLPRSGFYDVPDSLWCSYCVQWAVENGITRGTTETTFSPDSPCTLAQILTFLWRAEGLPQPGIDNPFTDVDDSDYYYNAALWAAERGLVSGPVLRGSTPCSRVQAVTFMWKMAGCPSGVGKPFQDVPEDSPYANAVGWAVDRQLTTGSSNTTFSPDDSCTRSQIAALLYRNATESNRE